MNEKQGGRTRGLREMCETRLDMLHLTRKLPDALYRQVRHAAVQK